MAEDRPEGNNPQGLATFDPMSDPGYRAVARRILDRYIRERGMAPVTWPEDVKEAEGQPEAVPSQDDC